MLYKASFRGRKLGAEGIFYPIVTYVHGDNRQHARLNLYKDWDHVFKLELEEVILEEKELG